MALSWWRKALNQSTKTTKPGTRRKSRSRLTFQVEYLEDRLVPTTYQWTGQDSAVNLNWNTPQNWSVNGIQQTVNFPSTATDVAQFVDPNFTFGNFPLINGAFTVGEIDFGSANNVAINADGVTGHGLTISSKIVSADTFGVANSGTDEISAPVTAANGLTVTNSAASGLANIILDNVTFASGASLTTSGTQATGVQINNLTTNGADTLTVNTVTTITTNIGSTAATDSLGLAGTSTLNIPLASTFAGTMNIKGANVVIGSNASLGVGGLTLSSGTLQANTTGIVVANPLTLTPSGSITLGDAFDPVGMTDNGLTLTGNYTDTGSFTITSQTYPVSTAIPGVILAGNGTGGGTLTVNGAGTPMFTGVLILAGTSNLSGVTVGATGALGLTNNNAIGAGTLTLQSGGAIGGTVGGLVLPMTTLSLPNGTVNFGSPLLPGVGITIGGAYTVPSALTVIANGPVTLTGSTTIAGTVTLTVNEGAANENGSLTLTASPITETGPLSLSNPGTQPLILTGAVNMGANALTLGGSVTLSGTLSTTAGLTVTGPLGTGANGVVLVGNNTGFSGATVINTGGALTVESATALGASPSITNNGTLTVQSVPGIGAAWYNWQPATAEAAPPISSSAPVAGLNVGVATLTGGNVTGVTLNTGGIGYTVAPTVTFINQTVDTTGAGATGTAVLGTGTQAGQVVSVTITNMGNGMYTAPPYVEFNSESTGSTDAGVHGPRSVLGNPVTPGTPAAILAYASALQAAGYQINDGIPGETSATTNAVNVNGTYFEYGGNTTRATIGGNPTGLYNGFPLAVQQSPPASSLITGGHANGSSIMGIFQGLFYAPVAGVYNFSTGSDDGSVMYIDGNLVVDNNNSQGYAVRSSLSPFSAASNTTAPSLAAGVHTIILEYFNGGGGYNFDAFVQGPTGSGYSGLMLNSDLTPIGSPGFFNFQLASLQGTGTLNVPAPGTGQVTLLAGSTYGGNITGQGTITVQSGAMTLTTDEGFTGTWVLNGTASLTLGTTGTPIAGENMSTIINNTTNNVVINNPSGNTFSLSASISGPTSGLTLNGTGTYNLGGISTFTGAVSIPAGVTVNITGTSPLGAGDVTLPASSTINVSGYTLGTGLAVTWYNWGGNTTPRTGAGGNPPAATIGPAPFTAANTPILAYANNEGVLPDGIPFETTATPNSTNVNGTYLEYGGNSGRATVGGNGNGFPYAVQNNYNNGGSIMGIFEGLFFAPTTGVYNFATASDDGSNMWVDGTLVVDNNNDQGYTNRSGTNPFDAGATTAPTLTAGVHSILIDYYNGGGGYQFDAFVNGVLLTNAQLGLPVINFSVGSLSGAGTVNLGTDGLSAGADGTSTTFTGTINGTATSNGVANFTKAGTGTMVIPNISQLNITGSLAITGGTLTIGNGTNALSALPVTSIVDNGTLILNAPSGSSLTYNGNITGSGGVTYQGVSTLTLGGNSSYTGPTVIPSAAGTTVNTTSNTALGNGNFNLPTGTTLNVTSTGTPNLGSGLPGQYFSLAATTNTGTATANDTLPDGRFQSVSGVAAVIAQYGTTGGVQGGTVVPIATDTSAFTTANTQGQNNTNSNGAIFAYGRGSTGLTSVGGFPNVVKTINGNSNSVMGVWTGIFFAPVAGTYNFDTVSDDGSTLFIDGNIIVQNNYGQGTTTRFGAVNMTAGAHQIEIAYFNGGGGWGLWADVELPGTTAFQRLPNSLLGTVAPSLLQIGALSGGGTVNLGVAGGTNNGLNAGGDNASTTFTGTINAPGTNIANFPNLIKSGTGIFTLPSGETYTGLTTISGSLVLGSATTPINATGGPGLPTTGITDNGNLTLFLQNSSSVAYNHSITGSGGVTINGTGVTLTLGATNSYTGPTNLGANTLVQGVANALPASSAITVGAGSGSGKVDLNGFNGGIGSITAVGTGTANVLTNSSSTAVTLTLTGTGSTINLNVPITGKLSLVVTGVGVDQFTPPAATPNSYTGSTTINGTTLIAENSGALPSGSALTVGGSGVLDLHGNSLVVPSLQGVGSTNTITNSLSQTPATLTITNTVATAQSFSYTGAITGSVSLVNATGPLTSTSLVGGPNSTFAGGVTTTSGTLGGVPGSFGTGPVNLNGGTLDLQGSQEVVGFGGAGVAGASGSAGASTAPGWTVNRNSSVAAVTGGGNFGNFGSVLPATNTWQATTNNGNEADDLIYNTPVQPNSGFTASFTYLDNTPGVNNPADGVTFMLEADPLGPFALGGTGGALGFGSGGNGSNANGSIKNSMAIALNLYSGAAGGRGTAIQTNGAINSTIDPQNAFSDLNSGHPLNVVFTYNASAQVITESFTDTVTGQTGAATFYGINLFSLLGGPNAFIGFSGGTGGAAAQQLISNFTYLGASGAATGFTNNIQATAGTTSSLTVQANVLANAYSTSGSLTVPATATVNIAADSASTTNQPYSMTVGGSALLGGSVNIANNGTGTGTLILAGPVNGIAPASGTSGAVSIGAIGGGGNVQLGSTSTYNEVLGGATQPGGWGNLGVSGALNLAGGTLNVSYANDFTPALNETFTILHSTGALSGAFANAPSSGSTIVAGGITYSVTYNANSVVLTATMVPVVMATQLTVTAPATATAGTPFSITIAATNASGITSGTNTDMVSISSSAGAGTVSPTTVTLASGSATLPITLTKSGAQTLTVTDVTNSMVTPGTASITVSPGAFSKFTVTTVTTIPGTTTAGNSFLIEVQAADSEGNPVSSYSGPSSITLSSSPSTSGFPVVLPLNSLGGATTVGTITTVGTYTLSATNSLGTFNSSPLTVTAAAAAKLGFTAQPANTPTGVKLGTVTVAVQDQFGNTVTTGSASTDSVTISVASFTPAAGVTGTGAFLTGSTLTVPAVAGVATFNNLTLVNPGSYTLGAIVPANFIGPNSNSFTVAPLQVTTGSFASSPSGFSLSFNAPFLVNSTTPVLYGTGFGATAKSPSVVLAEGTLASGTAVLTSGKVTSVTITSGGSGFPPPGSGGTTPTVTFGAAPAGGTTAKGTVNVSASGVITGVTITVQGSGYTTAPTVTFSVPNPVEGSVVLNTATNSLTFIETDTAYNANFGSPSLPDGTYTAIVRGTAANNGLQAINSGGGFLDGTNSGAPGTDYTTTFTVGVATAGDDIVWVPDTADGPLQTLAAPGNNQQTLFTGGYPVYLNDSTGHVTSVSVTFNYNPALLSVSSVSSNSALTGSTFTLLGSSTSGHAVLQFTGTAANAGLLTGGEVPLGFINATVPNSSAATPIYQAKDLLHLSAITVSGTGGAVPAVGVDGLHLVAYVGNATGSGSYSSADAVDITRVSLQTDTGFAAFPLVDPVVVADTDGVGFIPADAALQVNEAGVGFPTSNLSKPPIPAGANVTPIANNVDPTITLPSVLQVGANGVVTVPVNIDDADPAGSTGLIEADLALTFNPSLFTVSAADVHAGSVLAGGAWSVVPTIDQATGQIAIALSSATPIGSAIGGSLVTIDFHSTGEPGGVSPRSAAIELVASVDPNGQMVATELRDAQGSFTLTPAPTNNFNPRIDGVVTVTATPAAVAIGTPVVDTETLAVAAPVLDQATESVTVEFTVTEASITAPAVTAASDASEQEASHFTADTTAVHVIHSAASIVAAAASPITGLVFQFANTPVVNAQGSVAVGQHLTDQLFQALVRGANGMDPTLVSTAKETFERVLAGQLMLSPSTPDNLDNLDWDGMMDDMNLQDAGDSTAALVGPHGRRDMTVYQTTPPATVQQTVVDRAALDQLFAQTSDDDSDMTFDDE